MEGIFSSNISDKTIQNQESQNYPPFNETFNFEEKFDDVKNKKPKKKKNSENTIFKCEECGKTYLSYPALYTHYKTKHPDNKSDRKRGRPKKEEKLKGEAGIYNPYTKEFFMDESRNGKIDKSEFNNIIQKSFDNLYNTQNNSINNNMKICKNINDHSFFKKFLEDEHDQYKTIINQDEIIDIVFMNYLNKISSLCNENFYIKLISLIVLFRDFINTSNEKNIGDDYTENNEAEEVPNFTNSFIEKYFFGKESDNFLGLTYKDVEGILLNLCQWLYDHNYTSFKLSIKDNYNDNNNE